MRHDYAYRVEFFGDEIDRITEIDVLTGEIEKGLEFIAVFPASHYVVPMDKILKAADGYRGRAGRARCLV